MNHKTKTAIEAIVWYWQNAVITNGVPRDDHLVKIDAKMLRELSEAYALEQVTKGSTPTGERPKPYPNVAGTHRTGGLTGVSHSDISKVLGFNSNVDDDPYKVKYSWGFTYKGHQCAIWDYKGSYRTLDFSTYGPQEVFDELFPGKTENR